MVGAPYTGASREDERRAPMRAFRVGSLVIAAGRFLALDVRFPRDLTSSER